MTLLYAIDWSERRLRALDAAFLALVIAVQLALLVRAATTLSPTVDEPFHLVRGLAWWWAGTTDLSYAHPPLANALATAPVAWLQAPYDLAQHAAFDRLDIARLGRDVAKADYAAFSDWLVTARLTMMVFPVALVAYGAGWVQRHGGRLAGWAAAIALAFHPLVLAHGSLVTTDLPVTLFAVMAIGQLPAWIARRGVATWAGVAVPVALAASVKFSGLLLGPMVALAAGWAAWQQVGAFAGPWRWARWLGEGAAMVALLLLTVSASYRFEATGRTVGEVLDRPEPDTALVDDFDQAFLEDEGVLGALPKSLPVPLPATYAFGVEMVRYQGSSGVHRSWFAGASTGAGGHPLYFPTLLGLKQPLFVLFGLSAGLWVWWTRREQWLPIALGLPAVLSVALLVFLMRSSLNIGVRHALPVAAWSTLGAALGAAAAVREGPRWLAGLLVVALLGVPVAAAVDSPHHLSWFNALTGYRRGAYAISVVGEDWGQDVGGFADWALEHDVRRVRYVRYAGTTYFELRHRGLAVRGIGCRKKQPPQDTVFAVHRNLLVRRPRCFPWADRTPPTAVIGHHIYVWDTRASAPPARPTGARR